MTVSNSNSAEAAGRRADQPQAGSADVTGSGRAGPRRLIGVTVLGLSLGISSNILEPAVLGSKVLEFAPTWKNTAIGLGTFVGLLIAILVQPIAGARSDTTRSRWGRRTPYLVAGALLVMVSHLVIGLAPALWIVIAGLFALQLASNTAQGPWQALIPDQIPSPQRGLAAGLRAAMEILGFVIGRQIGGALVGEGNIAAASTIAGSSFLLGLAFTLWLAPDRHLPAATSQPSEAWWRAFHIPWRQRPDFTRWFINRALFWGSILLVNTFVLFFLIDARGYDESAAQQLVGRLGVVIGLAVLVFALPAGLLADRLGRRPLIATACLLAAIGVAALLVLDHASGVLLAAGLIGLSMAVFLSGSWALITDIVPSGQAAQYLGMANVASAGGSALGRALGGLLIDPINNSLGSSVIGYNVVFGGTVLALLLAAVVILPHTRAESATR